MSISKESIQRFEDALLNSRGTLRNYLQEGRLEEYKEEVNIIFGAFRACEILGIEVEVTMEEMFDYTKLLFRREDGLRGKEGIEKSHPVYKYIKERTVSGTESPV